MTSGATIKGKIDPLFEVANAAADPEGIITKYLEFESYRLVREHFLYDMVGAIQDRLKVLMWYLVDYIGHRGADYEIPLSDRQIAFLNSPVPLAGASPAVSVALMNFVAREKPSHINLLDDNTMREALYWWCVEKAPRSKLDRSLVSAAQIAVLRTETQWIGDDYPFNVFTTVFFNQHTGLHGLDMNIPHERAAFFHYLVLYAFAEPHIARFLPKDTIRRLMKDDVERTAILDQVITRLAFPEGTDVAEATKLRAMGADLMRHSGYGFYRQMPHSPSSHSGECFKSIRDLSHPVEHGVTIVGPIRKTSGLGQATRLSHDILAHIEDEKPTVLAFDMDNPAPIGFASNISVLPYANRREINLIHLNAESIPLAFAYEQREIFETSYNIGYFFWELNIIPKCQRLALDLLDEIWVSSEYNREIYSRFTDKPVINVGMAVESRPSVEALDRLAIGLDPNSTIFLTTFDAFSFIERKNPFGVIDAFRVAFPLGIERAQLVLKTQNRSRVSDPYQVELWKRIDLAVQQDQRIIIINETYPYRDVLALKLACDCYVSLHRSEGWGFGMIEAMQLGRPVIATAYSGNMDFCTDETAYLVDYDLISVREAEYIFVERGSVWAHPQVAHAAARMRDVAADPVKARAKGEAAANFIKTNFSIEAIGKRYAERLATIRESFRT